MFRRAGAAIALLMWLSSCGGTFDVSVPPTDDRLYAELYPYYAELCAVSQIRKKPGFGADTSGGPGGHSVLYLNGVCRDRSAGYPTITLCPPEEANREQGVGLSVNAHYKNANWIATDGRDFFFHGNLSPRERLTRAMYERAQDEAKRKGLLDGVVFHQEVFDDMPPGTDRRDFMYEVSIATDYAINFGRDRYCARVPLTRAQMGKAVTYLNETNVAYKNGKDFEWNVLQNNCTHLAHNALAAAGIWDDWDVDRFVLIAAFDFPVPKNEFVNLMRRTNDTDLSDIRALYADPVIRRELMEYGRLPVEPGALAVAEPVMQQNDIYDTRLHLIFYDDPMFGPYRRRFRRIFSEPRYTDIEANLHYTAALFERLASQRKSSAGADACDAAPSSDDFRSFCRRFYDHLERTAATAERTLSMTSRLRPVTGHGP